MIKGLGNLLQVLRSQDNERRQMKLSKNFFSLSYFSLVAVHFSSLEVSHYLLVVDAARREVDVDDTLTLDVAIDILLVEDDAFGRRVEL